MLLYIRIHVVPTAAALEMKTSIAHDLNGRAKNVPQQQDRDTDFFEARRLGE
jgi:hypothetical protein